MESDPQHRSILFVQQPPFVSSSVVVALPAPPLLSESVPTELPVVPVSVAQPLSETRRELAPSVVRVQVEGPWERKKTMKTAVVVVLQLLPVL